MNKVFLLLICSLFISCERTEEASSINLKKGDSFFAQKEYEVAEYYYEKIPEDSPLYKQAKKKLDEIAAIKKQWAEKNLTPVDMSKIIILDHTWTVDNVSRTPVHRLSIVNQTQGNLEAVEAEFTYYDKANKVIEKLVCKVKTPMYSGTQDVFKGIQPGFVREEFANSTVKILSARFQ